MTTSAVARPTTTLARVGAVAAIVAGAALLTKVAVIVVTSNRAPEMLTGALYVLGVFAPLIAAAGIASWLDGGWAKKVGVYVGVVLLHLFYITMLSDGVGALVEPFTDAAYLVDEVPVAVSGLVWLIVGLTFRRRVEAGA